VNFEHIIEGSFKKIEFEPGELAFLAATSKIERPIQDRLSWRLQQALQDHDVIREWNMGGGRRKVDITVLKDESPVAVIELTAMYTFDAALEKHMQFVAKISGDEQKALKLVGPDVPIFTILLAAHPKPSNPERMKSFVKYDDIKKSLRTATCDEVAAAADRKVRDSFLAKAPRNLAFRHIVRGIGESFSIPFDIHVWCFRFVP